MNTWDYLTFGETSEISEEWVWERLRHRRNGLLALCDLKMILDAPWDVAPWKIYRQSLRDLPAQTKDPRKAIWPVSPNGLTVPPYTEPYVYVEPIIEPVLEYVFDEEECDEAKAE